jgi:hypothetical protein
MSDRGGLKMAFFCAFYQYFGGAYCLCLQCRIPKYGGTYIEIFHFYNEIQNEDLKL